MPRPTPGRPPVPDGFAGQPEEALWVRVCDTLEDMGLLTTADWAAVERYAANLAEWRRVREFLRRNGNTYTLRTTNPAAPHIGELPTPAGGGPVVYAVGRYRHPEYQIKLDLEKELRAFEQVFGLNPGARGRLLAPVPGPRLGDGGEGEASQVVRARVRE